MCKYKKHDSMLFFLSIKYVLLLTLWLPKSILGYPVLSNAMT